jgi:hypothetical protein
MQGCLIGELGAVLATPAFTLVGRQGHPVVQSDIAPLKQAWQRPLQW